MFVSTSSRKSRKAHCEEGFNGEPPEKGDAGSVHEGSGDGCEREEGDGQVDLSDNDIF